MLFVFFFFLLFQVSLWDSEENFKKNTPFVTDRFPLQSVFFNVTAAMNAPKQFTTQSHSSDISMFFGTTSNIPFQSNVTEEPSKDILIPPLVSVVLNLLHATQVESSNIVSVCLESLFKIALWCPNESPLRQLIAQEFYEISASSFGLNFPLLSNVEPQDSLDLFQSPFTVDPRSLLSTLDQMGLAHVVESPFSSTPVDPTICQFQARKFGNEWHGSSVCRESNLYSLALESLSVAKDPPQFSSNQEVSDMLSADSNKNQNSGSLFGMDFLGEPIPHHPLVRENSQNIPTEMQSNFVVDGVELKKLFYQLDQKAIFNI